MKVLVCGSRSWVDGHAIRERLGKLPIGSTVIHGGARGADRLAGAAASSLGYEVIVVPADWSRHGRKAGYLRNFEMLAMEPELVLAFWDGHSAGTAHTIQLAKNRHIPVEVIE